MNAFSKECVVSNDTAVNVFERLFKLWTMICKMVMDGTRDAERVASVLQSVVDGLAGVKVYLRRLFETEVTTIGATDGTETFASSGLFTGGVYGVDLSGVAGASTPAVTLNVHEMIEDGAFRPVFESLGTSGNEELEQSQVNAFVRDHPDKLRRDGYGTFFRLKGGFVASVRFGGLGRLRVSVIGFSSGYVWLARYRRRFVSPQQQL